jgi:hypothetical protein
MHKFLVALTSVILVSCGGSSDGGGSYDDGLNDPAVKTGVFIDSAVEGINWSTATQSGTTNSDGEFSYIEGESVIFSIGDITLPSVTAQSTVSPLDMAGTNDTTDATLVNIARLLQTLDLDADAANGITIDSQAHTAAQGMTIDFSSASFDTDVQSLVTNSGSSNISLIDASTAISHLSSNVQCTPTLSEYITGKRINLSQGYFQFNYDGSYVAEFEPNGSGGYNVSDTGSYSVAGLVVSTLRLSGTSTDEHHGTLTFNSTTPLAGDTFDAVSFGDAEETITDPNSNVIIGSISELSSSSTLKDYITGKKINLSQGYFQFNYDGTYIAEFEPDGVGGYNVSDSGTYSVVGLVVTTLRLSGTSTDEHHTTLTFSTTTPLAGDSFDAVTYGDAQETISNSNPNVSIDSLSDLPVSTMLEDYISGKRIVLSQGFFQFNYDGTYTAKFEPNGSGGYDVSDYGSYTVAGLVITTLRLGGTSTDEHHTTLTFDTTTPVAGDQFDAVSFGDAAETISNPNPNVSISSIGYIGNICF